MSPNLRGEGEIKENSIKRNYGITEYECARLDQIPSSARIEKRGIQLRENFHMKRVIFSTERSKRQTSNDRLEKSSQLSNLCFDTMTKF